MSRDLTVSNRWGFGGWADSQGAVGAPGVVLDANGVLTLWRSSASHCWKCGAGQDRPLLIARRVLWTFLWLADSFERIPDSRFTTPEPLPIDRPGSPMDLRPARYSGRVESGAWLLDPLDVDAKAAAAIAGGLERWVEGRSPRHRPRPDPRFDPGADRDCHDPLGAVTALLERPKEARRARVAELLVFLARGPFQIGGAPR
ncbi:MAG: hypothetical protein AB7R55_14700 [Gemmatimonadales bacterium]